jgi:hypothetical protein
MVAQVSRAGQRLGGGGLNRRLYDGIKPAVRVGVL